MGSLKYAEERRELSLSALLKTKKPDLVGHTVADRIYFTSAIPEVNKEALMYFAASMFWRAAIYPWKSDGTYPVRLGPYEDAYRRYLLGEADFPTNSTLSVILRKKSVISHLSFEPVGGRIGGAHVHRFPMPGLAFMLYVGNEIPDICR